MGKAKRLLRQAIEEGRALSWKARAGILTPSDAIIAGRDIGYKMRGVEPPSPTLTCYKCRTEVETTEEAITAHLKVCQPGGAICDKCGVRQSPEAFYSHYQACDKKGIKTVKGYAPIREWVGTEDKYPT